MPPAARELGTATQADAVEFETLAEAVNRQPDTSGTMARNILIVAGAFILSRVLGFLREILFAHQFGTTGQADAYVAAFRVPDLLFLTVMSAGFGSAFIPVFAGFLTRGDTRRAWNLASAVLSWAVVITVAAGLLIFAFAEPIIRYLIAPDLPASDIALSASLMRVIVLSPLLLGLGIAAKGILEAQDRFLWPAMAPLVYNVGIIVGLVVLVPRFGIKGVAYGVVVGALAHFAIQIPSLIRSGMRFRFDLRRDIPGLTQVGRLLIPRVIGQSAFAINFMVVVNIASSIGEGGASSINYAWQLLMLPHGILALSISTVIFPTMARLWERQDVAGLARTFARAVRPLVFLSVPVSIVLYLFREPIVAALLQRGDFTRASTVAVAAPLAALAVTLVAYGIVEVLTRAFYAMKDARTPVIAGVVIIAINIIIALATVDRFGELALGLSLGSSTVVEAIILGIVFVGRLQQHGLTISWSWVGWLGRIAAAGIVAAAFGVAAAGPLNTLWDGSHGAYLTRLFLLVIAAALVLVPYGLIAWATGIPEYVTLERRLGRFIAPLANAIPAARHADLGISRGVAFTRGDPLDVDAPPADEADLGAAEEQPDDREPMLDDGRADGQNLGAERDPLDQASRRDGSGFHTEREPAESRTDARRRRPRLDGIDRPIPPPLRPLPSTGAFDQAPVMSGDNTGADRDARFSSGTHDPDFYQDPEDDTPYGPRSTRQDEPDGPTRGIRGTGRFGNGRAPDRYPRRDRDSLRTGREAADDSRPFRSTRQTTLPSWYTPQRRPRRAPAGTEPEQANDYTYDLNGRPNRPRRDR